VNIFHEDWGDKLAEWATEKDSVYDAVFLDVARPYPPDGYDTAFPWDYEQSAYIAQMKSNIDEVCATKRCIINGAVPAFAEPNYTDTAEGTLVEGFCHNAAYPGFTYWRIKQGIDAMLYGPTENTAVHVVTMGTTVAQRIVAMAAFFMGGAGLADGGTYQFADTGEDADALQFYPEYELNLGCPIGDPADWEDLEQSEYTDLLARYYTSGIVIINAHDAQQTFTLPAGTWETITPSGGGLVDTDGTYPAASLVTAEVSGTVDIPAETGMILRKVQ
jgi:hypothetical protein